MQTAYLCIFIAIFLPYIWAFSSVIWRYKQFGCADFRQPREQADQLTDAGARVVSAQHNAWEALIIYSAVVFLAYANEAPSQAVSAASVVFIVARILHGFFYIASLSLLRIASFLCGFGACLWIASISIF